MDETDIGVGKRVKAIRLDRKLNQTEFGKPLSVSQNYLSSMESGEKPFTDKIIKLICLIYGVSEDWLRTGQGSRYVEIDEDDKYSKAFSAASMEEDEFAKALLIEYMDLSKDDREVVKKMILRISERIKKSSD